MRLAAHLKYWRYIIRHKWFVFRAGLLTGAPLLRLVIHDWTKLSPIEWFAYARKFYGPPPTNESERCRIEYRFNLAWLHHQHRNAHHWQHWMLREDSGNVICLKMPERLVREMVADWMGAGRAITGRWEVGDWYANNREKIQLHPDSRQLVELIIEEVTREHARPLPDSGPQHTPA